MTLLGRLPIAVAAFTVAFAGCMSGPAAPNGPADPTPVAVIQPDTHDALLRITVPPGNASGAIVLDVAEDQWIPAQWPGNPGDRVPDPDQWTICIRYRHEGLGPHNYFRAFIYELDAGGALLPIARPELKAAADPSIEPWSCLTFTQLPVGIEGEGAPIRVYEGGGVFADEPRAMRIVILYAVNWGGHTPLDGSVFSLGLACTEPPVSQCGATQAVDVEPSWSGTATHAAYGTEPHWCPGGSGGDAQTAPRACLGFDVDDRLTINGPVRQGTLMVTHEGQGPAFAHLYAVGTGHRQPTTEGSSENILVGTHGLTSQLAHGRDAITLDCEAPPGHYVRQDIILWSAEAINATATWNAAGVVDYVAQLLEIPIDFDALGWRLEPVSRQEAQRYYGAPC